MKKWFLFLSIVFAIQPLAAQNKPVKQSFTLDQNTIVKDSSGQTYRYEIWRKLLMTGYYDLKPESPSKANTPFLLVRLSDEQRKARLDALPKPRESTYFTTGKEVESFTSKDINGNKIKLKDLKGKIVVLNFWFINCVPCQSEILELNKLVGDYKDSSIVFIAIAPDSRSELRTFLKTHPFDYTIVDNAQNIIDQYGIKSFPTHLIIDKEGKVAYHSAGAGVSTIHWLRKTIDEIRALRENAGSENKDISLTGQ